MASSVKKKQSPGKRKFIKALTVMFCMGVIVSCVIVIVLTFSLASVIKNRSNIDISHLNLNYTTIIYANDKQGVPYEVERVHGAENRVWASIDDLPSYIGNAAIAVEDQRFMSHHGVDFKRTIFAFLNEIFHFSGGRQGGSTITQQLVKNITGDNKVQAARKLREIISALYLEKHATKGEILEAYLNVVYFGNNTNGIEAAANLYFDKPAKELTLQEAVAIIAITKHPVRYDLFNHPEQNAQRREYILKKMLEFNFITKSEYKKAVDSKLVVSERHNPSKKNVAINSYFVDYLINDVIASLVEKYGYTEQYATHQLYSGGYRVYSTMDEHVQNVLQERFENSSAFSNIYGGKGQLQAAMVVMDNNGCIVGLVGGRGKKTVNRGLNRATDTLRQPGSAIKPVSVYALAIEQNKLNYSSIVTDEPFKTINDRPWPHNVDNVYRHKVLLPYAISHSLNTVAVHTCDALGPQNCFNFMKNKLGVNSLISSKIVGGKEYSDQNHAAMALGALTEGVSVLELTSAYQIFANGGLFFKPHAYSQVLDSHGNVVLENTQTSTRVISKSTAVIMNKLLQGVITSGTGRAAALGNFNVAGKTGTTSDDKDVWFVGCTPYYTGGVWVGYDTPTPMKGLWYGGKYPPTAVWREVMTEIHKTLPHKDFPEDEKGVKHCEYCNSTGLLASSGCTNRSTGLYRTSNLPATCPGNHPAPAPAPTTQTNSSSTPSTPNQTENNQSASNTPQQSGSDQQPAASQTSVPVPQQPTNVLQQPSA